MAGGKFIIYKTAKGYYNFRLIANNKLTIAVSGGTGYASLSSCKSGIESVKKLVGTKIEDQTLAKFESLANPKYEIYEDKAGKFRFRLRARNAELICISEDGYASKASCKKGIESLEKWAVDAEIEVE